MAGEDFVVEEEPTEGEVDVEGVVREDTAEVGFLGGDFIVLVFTGSEFLYDINFFNKNL